MRKTIVCGYKHARLLKIYYIYTIYLNVGEETDEVVFWEEEIARRRRIEAEF